MRSPLSRDDKEWFILRCQHNLLTTLPLLQYGNLGHIIVAHCLAISCPEPSERVLTKSTNGQGKNEPLRKFFLGAVKLQPVPSFIQSNLVGGGKVLHETR